MKKTLILTGIILLAAISSALAQFKRVNESCEQMPCENGLYCVETKYGKKCSECDQSKIDSYRRDVDNACKTCDEGWKPGSNAQYNQALAFDGRVAVEVFDAMLEIAKRCRQIREERERNCWKGGDDNHKKEIEKVKESIENGAAHKYKMIVDRQVYYTSKSNYESYLRTFNSKTDLNFPDINQKLDVMLYEINRGNKVSCSDIERYSNDCERGYGAAKDLFYYGFSNDSNKLPRDYEKKMQQSEETFKKAKDLLQTVKNKSLCN